MSLLKRALIVYSIICTIFMTLALSMGVYGGVTYRTMRAPLPNGAYLNRAHPFSEQIVLRAPDGEIVVRDVAHVLFNDQYVAGAFYETPYSTERFVYKVGDERAFRNLAGDDDPFDAIFDASGLEAEWPWGPEDPNWLDFNQLLVKFGYRSPFPG